MKNKAGVPTINKAKSSALKKCPFCGSRKIGVYNYDETFDITEEHRQGGFSAVCNAQEGGCGASSGWAATYKEARESWNKRV